jgi:hypothetical protein
MFMRLTEQEIDMAITKVLNEYNDDFDNEWDESYGEQPTEEKSKESNPFPTMPFLLEIAMESEIYDDDKLIAIKNVALQMPKTIVVRADYNTPYGWEEDEDGGYKNYDYQNQEIANIDIYLKEGDEYVPVLQWLSKNQLRASEEEIGVVKNVIEMYIDAFKEQEIGERAFDKYLRWTENDMKKSIANGKFDAIGKSKNGGEQNILSESAMRNIIYEKIIKALDECCK